MSTELMRLNKQIEQLEAEQARDPDPTLNLVLEELYTERDNLSAEAEATRKAVVERIYGEKLPQ